MIVSWCGLLYICFFRFWFEVKVIVKMFAVLWIVDCGIVRCCCCRIFIDNFEFNYLELVFGDMSYLGYGPYGLKIFKYRFVIKKEHGIDIVLCVEGGQGSVHVFLCNSF